MKQGIYGRRRGLGGAKMMREHATASRRPLGRVCVVCVCVCTMCVLTGKKKTVAIAQQQQQ